MTERRTGATSAQIEAAVEQRNATVVGYVDCGLVSDNVSAVASALVDAEHRIVRVDDLRALLNIVKRHTQAERSPLTDRIAALIGDADE